MFIIGESYNEKVQKRTHVSLRRDADTEYRSEVGV